MSRFLGLVASVLVLVVTCGRIHAQSLQAYQQAMVTYRQYQAQFERDRLLYQNNDGITFETVMDSASHAFATRREAVLSYSRYLRTLVKTYITNTATLESLISRLDAHEEEINHLSVTFDSLGSWQAAESTSNVVYGRFSETVYQCFTQIYLNELDAIIQGYQTLADTQPERILDEATSNVERESKSRIIQNATRTLISLQRQLTTLKRDATYVNSASSYTLWRENADQLLASTQKSLKEYASLE